MKRVKNIKQNENAVLLLYNLTKYQFARESINPVAGTTRFCAQTPFINDKYSVFASNATPIVIKANEANNKTDCKTDAFQSLSL